MLSGRLEDSGLIDALQLVARRPGASALELEGEGRHVVLRFLDGHLVDAWEPGRPSAACSAARLLRQGVIEDADLGAALTRSARTGRPLSQILGEDFGVPPSTWAEVGLWARQDCLVEPMTWQAGRYRLRAAGAFPASTRGFDPGLAGSQLVLLAVSVRQVWPRVVRWVPRWDLEVERRRLPSAPRPGKDWAPDWARPLGVGLSVVERAAWRWASEGRSASEIADRVPGPRVASRWALARLVARGDLEWAPHEGRISQGRATDRLRLG